MFPATRQEGADLAACLGDIVRDWHEIAREMRDECALQSDGLGSWMWSEMRHGLRFDAALEAHTGGMTPETVGWLLPLRGKSTAMSLDEWAEWWSSRSSIRTTDDVLGELRAHLRVKRRPIWEFYGTNSWAEMVYRCKESPEYYALGRLLAPLLGRDLSIPF